MEPFADPEDEFCDDCSEVNGWKEDSTCNKYGEWLRFDHTFESPIRLERCKRDAEKFAREEKARAEVVVRAHKEGD